QDSPAGAKLASPSSPPPAGAPAPSFKDPHIEASARLAPALAIPDAAPANASRATTPNADRPLPGTITSPLVQPPPRPPANGRKGPRAKRTSHRECPGSTRVSPKVFPAVGLVGFGGRDSVTDGGGEWARSRFPRRSTWCGLFQSGRGTG